MPKSEFRQQISGLAGQLAGKELNETLQTWLNDEHGNNSLTRRQLEQSCRTGVEEGWLCEREAGGIRYGRVFKPAEDLHGFSVDVVDMENIAGPHHIHPKGEIDLVIPLEGKALFDHQPAGWLVYPAGSAHRPEVSNGRALILYLLPEGSIEFTNPDNS